MLTQWDFYGRDENEGRGEGENGGRGGGEKSSAALSVSRSPLLPFAPLLRFTLLPLPVFSLSLVLCVASVIFLSTSCGSKPTEPRTVIPADALVYLESTDLGEALEAITSNSKFQQLARKKPNLSALGGVKLAVAIVGFEASEEKVTDEDTIINLQPHFVAVAETNAWSWQTKAFVKDRLGQFLTKAYGGTIELEVVTRNDGEFYVWTSREGQKTFALQQGSLVYFGNDEAAIERCLSVKRGETPSIASAGKIPDGERLAFGYISEDGVGQIGNLIGIQLAKSTGEDADVQSFVATVLPQIFRNSAKEVSWTSAKTEAGIEDKITVALDNESATVFSETLVPTQATADGLTGFVPESAATATRYLLRDPQVAWRSVVLTAGKKTDSTSGTLLVAFSGSVFEPYGIEDPESFLSSVGSPILTVELTADTEDAVVIAPIKDAAKVRSAIAREINFDRAAERQFDADVWRSEDGELAVGIVNNIIVSGDAQTVLKCLEARSARANVANETEFSRQFGSSDAVAVTVANDRESARKLVSMFSEINEPAEPVMFLSRIETRFNRNGIERRVVSDFGWIGAIIVQLVQE